MQTMAFTARITARPLTHTKNHKQLACVKECKQHFDGLVSSKGQKYPPSLGVDQLNCFLSHAVVRPQHYDMMSTAFQSIIKWFGDHIAGDEKLWVFKGDSPLIRQVPSKPGGIGLWMYELCCMLSDGNKFLLYFRVHDNSAADVASIPVMEIVLQWADIIDAKTPPGRIPTLCSCLIHTITLPP
jgi:hypothetical protein